MHSYKVFAFALSLKEKMKRIYLILICLLIPAIDSFGQKADLVTGSVIVVDGVEVCQFVTDKNFIYLHNFSSAGVSIYNQQGDDFKAIQKMLRNYFTGKQVKVISESQILPEGFVVSLKQFEKSTVPLNPILQTTSAVRGVNGNIQAAGGLFLAAEIFPISGALIVQANPTVSNVRTAQVLNYVGSALRIVGALVMIGSN